LVDDDPIVLAVAAEWLRAAGHQVTTREEALGTTVDIAAHRPDVVLIDVLMPGLRGDDLVRLIKRHPATRGTPVILHSSLELDGLRPLIMATGALGAIEKTGDRAKFLLSFQLLAAKLKPSSHAVESAAPPTVSGTYPVAKAVEDSAPSAPKIPLVRKRS
jgi:CheY-like chemotaxis protein